MVGNGATNWDFDVGPSYPQTLYNFNMISKKVYDKYQIEDQCVVFFNGVRNTTGANATDCERQMDEVLMGSAIDGLNWYDLYRPAEPMLENEELWGTTVINGVERKYKRGYTMSEYTAFMKLKPRKNEKMLGAFLTDYLNNETVQAALHIPAEYNMTWSMCNGAVGALYQLNATAETSPSVWIYPVLKEAGIRMMFYSGDTDGAVSTYGSKLWINKLNFCLAADWRAWYSEGQVAGYIKQFESLDFVTVKGVGHMAPQWARKPVADLITQWMHTPDSEIPTCVHED